MWMGKIWDVVLPSALEARELYYYKCFQDFESMEESKIYPPDDVDNF